MKKPVLVLALGMLLAGLPAFSQATAYPKEAYYKSVPIQKIWSSDQGYVVQFWNSKSQMSNIYVPLSWFNQGSLSKADLVYGSGPEFPYFMIVWVDGKFDHITLYVLENFESLTWGVLSSSVDLTSQFNIQEPPKDF